MHIRAGTHTALTGRVIVSVRLSSCHLYQRFFVFFKSSQPGFLPVMCTMNILYIITSKASADIDNRLVTSHKNYGQAVVNLTIWRPGCDRFHC